jgi:hypothetical protein
MPEEIMDPGADLAIKLLDKMINKNGTDPAMIAIGEGVKASITVSCSNNIKISKHIDNKSVHTARGIIFQKGVLKWMLGGIFVVSALVQYVPGVVKWFIGLF